MTVERTPLLSSMLKQAEYNDELRELTVWFVSGQPYTFSGVPQHVFAGLRDADSPGSYYHQNIKGVYS